MDNFHFHLCWKPEVAVNLLCRYRRDTLMVIVFRVNYENDFISDFS